MNYSDMSIRREDVSDYELLQYVAGMAQPSVIEKIAILGNNDPEFADELDSLLEIAGIEPAQMSAEVRGHVGIKLASTVGAPEMYRNVYTAAEEIYSRGLDWVSFYRETLGVDGLVRRVFNSKEEMAAFEQSSEYEGIQLMVARLRARGNVLPQVDGATRLITVRLPQSLHDTSRAEAYRVQTSVNKLCISRLMQLVDGELVPQDEMANAKYEPNEAGAAQEIDQ